MTITMTQERNCFLIDTRREIDSDDMNACILKEVERFFGVKYFQDYELWDWSAWPLLGIGNGGDMAGHASGFCDPDKTTISFKEMRRMVGGDAVSASLKQVFNVSQEYNEELL